MTINSINKNSINKFSVPTSIVLILKLVVLLCFYLGLFILIQNKTASGDTDLNILLLFLVSLFGYTLFRLYQQICLWFRPAFIEIKETGLQVRHFGIKDFEQLLLWENCAFTYVIDKHLYKRTMAFCLIYDKQNKNGLKKIKLEISINSLLVADIFYQSLDDCYVILNQFSQKINQNIQKNRINKPQEDFIQTPSVQLKNTKWVSLWKLHNRMTGMVMVTVVSFVILSLVLALNFSVFQDNNKPIAPSVFFSAIWLLLLSLMMVYTTESWHGWLTRFRYPYRLGVNQQGVVFWDYGMIKHQYQRISWEQVYAYDFVTIVRNSGRFYNLVIYFYPYENADFLLAISFEITGVSSILRKEQRDEIKPYFKYHHPNNRQVSTKMSVVPISSTLNHPVYSFLDKLPDKFFQIKPNDG